MQNRQFTGHSQSEVYVPAHGVSLQMLRISGIFPMVSTVHPALQVRGFPSRPIGPQMLLQARVLTQRRDSSAG